MIKALFFDLDGTIIDSSKDINSSLNHALRNAGQKPVSLDETISFIGGGISSLIEKATPGKMPEERKSILSMFLKHYRDHLVDNTTIYQSVEDTLRSLTSYKKAIISNKRECLSREILRKLSLLHYFDDIVGSDTFNAKKPSPVSVFNLLNKYSLSHQEAMIIGDSNIDIETGENAGITTVGVTYGYRPVISLKKADFIIDNIEELLKLLE